MAEALSGCSSIKSEECRFAEVKNLVKVMMKDPFLLTNWSEFSDSLESPAHEKLRWKNGLNRNHLEYYDLFSEILTSWIARNPRRTVRNLTHILRNMNCASLAEELERNFETTDLIQRSVDYKGVKDYRTDGFCNGQGPKTPLFLSHPNEHADKRQSTEIENRFVRTGEKIKWPITHGITRHAGNFSGRESELQKLNSHFTSNDNLMLICGFGGIGKTELCRKFANDIHYSVLFRLFRIVNSGTSRIWLSGETTQMLSDSILKLVRKLGVSNKAEPNPVEYLDYVVNLILEKSKHLLLVVDNVDEKYEEVAKVIKMAKVYPQLFIIVTSRNSMVLDNAGITVKLDVLDKEEARKILLTLKCENVANSDADKLCELVQYYPLALQQAVAYIKEQQTHFRTGNYSVSNYVKEFEKKKSEMLSQELNSFEHDYSMTTLVTWDITFRKMSEAAVQILNILAYLEPDGIDISFLERICTTFELETVLDQELDSIRIYSLVKIEDGIISIHRLVQEVIRRRIKNPGFSKTLFESVFLVCAKANETGKRLSILRSDLSHLNNVCKFALNCEMVTLDVFYVVLEFLLNHGIIDCAVEYVQLTYKNIQFSSDLDEKGKFELLVKVFLWNFFNGVNSVTNEMLESGTNDCSINILRGNFMPKKSSKLLEAASNLAGKYLGQISEVNFAIKYLQAFALWWLDGDKKKAFSICEELYSSPIYLSQQLDHFLNCKELSFASRTTEITFELNRIFFEILKPSGSLHNSLGTMEELAETLHKKGDCIKSLVIYLELLRNATLKTRKEKSEMNKYKSKVIELKIELSDFSSKDDEIVEKLRKVEYTDHPLQRLEQILPVYKRKLGENNLVTVKVKRAIAKKLSFEDRTVYCEDDDGRCIALCEQVLESQADKEYKGAFNTLCAAKHIQDNYDEQKVILEKLFKYKDLSLGDSHSCTIRIKGLLAQIHEKAGEFELALELFEQVKDTAIQMEWEEEDLKLARLNAMRVKLRIGDFNNLKTLDDIHREFREFEDYRDLESKELERILGFYSSVLGKDDKVTLQVRNAMVWKLWTERNYNEAFSLLHQVIVNSEDENVIKGVVETISQFGDSLSDEDYVHEKELLEAVFSFRNRCLCENHGERFKTIIHKLTDLFQSSNDSS